MLLRRWNWWQYDGVWGKRRRSGNGQLQLYISSLFGDDLRRKWSREFIMGYEERRNDMVIGNLAFNQAMEEDMLRRFCFH